MKVLTSLEKRRMTSARVSKSLRHSSKERKLKVIIWGKKIVRSHLGYAADFCPICACPRPFALTRVGSAGHVYYITADEGDLVGYERACMVCTTALHADPANYAEIAKQPANIRALAQQTFPNLAHAYQTRLAQERAIRLDSTMLPAAERQALILEPFTLLTVKVSNQFANSAFSSNARFMQREVLPILARALRRLRPTQVELQSALARLTQMKEPIGSKVKLADLWAELQRPAPLDKAVANGLVAGGSGAMVGDEAAKRLSAAKLMRVLSYLVAASAGLLALLTLVPSDGLQAPTGLWVIVVLALVLAYAVYRASAAVKMGAPWGRYAGIGFGLFLLAGFPVGTALGGYLLWTLLLKWGGPQATA
jgi:hypothetical protein